MAGLWCVAVGYGRKELAEVAYDQMLELPYYNSFFKCSTPTPVLLAQKLAEIAPRSINQVFFGSSGSESNDTALRLVRHYWALEGKPEKNTIISRTDAYHGSTVAGVSLGGMKHMHGQLGGAVPNIVHVMPPYAFELAEPGESDDAFGLRAAKAVEDAILEAGPDNVAAFIGEPIMGAGGVKIPPGNYWPEVERICRKYDVLLMLDEVITGYGRTGNWFAAQTYGIEPDMITISQGADVRLPAAVGAAGRRPRRRDHRREGRRILPRLHLFRPSGRLRGRPEEPRDHRARRSGRARARATPAPISSRRSGSASPAIRWSARRAPWASWARSRSSRTRRPASAYLPAGSAAVVVRDHAIADGLMMRATGDTMILSPPLIWTRDTIDIACEKILKALDLALADLRGK